MDADSHRDNNGRFTPGNPGDPGGARRKPSELRRAAEEAVTPEMLRLAMRKCASLAIEITDHEVRLAEIEKAAGAVDLGEGGRP